LEKDITFDMIGNMYASVFKQRIRNTYNNI